MLQQMIEKERNQLELLTLKLAVKVNNPRTPQDFIDPEYYRKSYIVSSEDETRTERLPRPGTTKDYLLANVKSMDALDFNTEFIEPTVKRFFNVCSCLAWLTSAKGIISWKYFSQGKAGDG